MTKPSLILRLYSCISEYGAKRFIIFESKVLVIISKTVFCTSLYPIVLFPILILLHKTFGTIYCLARSKSITPFHIVQYTTLNVFFTVFLPTYRIQGIYTCFQISPILANCLKECWKDVFPISDEPSFRFYTALASKTNRATHFECVNHCFRNRWRSC